MSLKDRIKFASRRRTLLRYLRYGAGLHSIGQSQSGSDVMYYEGGEISRFYVGIVRSNGQYPFFAAPAEGWGVHIGERAKKISDTLNSYWKLKDNKL